MIKQTAVLQIPNRWFMHDKRWTCLWAE